MRTYRRAAMTEYDTPTDLPQFFHRYDNKDQGVQPKRTVYTGLLSNLEYFTEKLEWKTQKYEYDNHNHLMLFDWWEIEIKEKEMQNFCAVYLVGKRVLCEGFCGVVFYWWAQDIRFTLLGSIQCGFVTGNDLNENFVCFYFLIRWLYSNYDKTNIYCDRVNWKNSFKNAQYLRVPKLTTFQVAHTASLHKLLQIRKEPENSIF